MGKPSTPLHKENLAWPLAVSSQGLLTVTKLKRYASALWHLLRTNPGAYWCDPLYGASFELLRAQGLTPTAVEQAKARLAMCVGRYIPDILIQDVSVDMDHEEQSLTVKVVWIIRSADPAMHGDLGRPQTTMVSY